MAITTTIVPNLNINLTGKNLLTELNQNYNFTISTKLEQSYSLNNTDPIQTLDITDLENIRFFIFESSSPFNITINMLLPVPQTITFYVQDVFIFSPAALFITNLDNIQIEATTITKQTINIRIYGVA